MAALAQTPSSDTPVNKVDAICQQVDNLIQQIEEKYATYANDTVYYDLLYKSNLLNKSVQERTFEKIESELNKLRSRIKEVNDSIQYFEKEIEWVDTVPRYYASHTLDVMFDAVDLQTLETHQKLLVAMDKTVPDAINYLHKMHESFDLLKHEYDEKATNECLNLLNEVPDCTKKKELKWLLETHRAVTNETNAWLSGKEEHSLYNLMDFKKYLKDYYDVDLEKHYPFLAEKARKSIIFNKQ